MTYNSRHLNLHQGAARGRSVIVGRVLKRAANEVVLQEPGLSHSSGTKLDVAGEGENGGGVGLGKGGPKRRGGCEGRKV